ncbi:helix-turn-helix domain-containing protein [Bremerella sp. P1]|uniref:helix-turn-helix domain-containing protein n=1 Tax=Bremerella sp. P1 TaxID=3026424 RepID=UPI0023689E07|nr:helix-turn-helix domain-containing protein [Bremerella sp. P1]WDI41031.1 helix-turn-helix domain-containing protein [Bremerella sp. P1]
MIRTLRREDWFGQDGFPLAVERRDPQEPFGLHKHEFSEVVIITGGTGLHITDEDSWELQKGDAFVIGEDRIHDYHNMANLRLINILFDQELLARDPKDLSLLSGYHALFCLEPNWRQRHQFSSHLTLSPRELTAAVEIVDRLDRELVNRTPGYKCLATAFFQQLVVHLSRCYGSSQHESSRSLLRIAEAISYIEQHYSEDIQLEVLTEIAGMSRRSFMRAFEEATGSTPIAYLIQLRLSRSAELLWATDKSVTEIAFEVGFNDSNYFSRQFRKRFNVSPREYRNNRF